MNLLQITSVQDSFQQMQQVAADVEPQAAMNALDLAIKGGWIMIVLLLLLLLSVSVLIEGRWSSTKQARRTIHS